MSSLCFSQNEKQINQNFKTCLETFSLENSKICLFVDVSNINGLETSRTILLCRMDDTKRLQRTKVRTDKRIWVWGHKLLGHYLGPSLTKSRTSSAPHCQVIYNFRSQGSYSWSIVLTLLMQCLNYFPLSTIVAQFRPLPSTDKWDLWMDSFVIY
jgi:hypothetical protein